MIEELSFQEALFSYRSPSLIRAGSEVWFDRDYLVLSNRRLSFPNQLDYFIRRKF